MLLVGRHGLPAEPAGGGGPRTEILQLFQDSSSELTATQQDLVQRALRMARVTIREVMMPWNRVIGVPATISRDGFRALVKHYNVSRMPVLGKSTTEVLGIIEVLAVLAETTDGGFSIQRHMHPPMTLIGEQSVRSAITLMQKARQTIAVVVDRNGRAQGLVTMKDLIEELVGDLENW
jgi:CBS domain containing-hemolysin-like protein